MAAKKLKVFKTTVGFHDAYVAAPSQKAALEAWGSDHNLFATGAAEQITDEAAMAEPLAKPGEVIKKVRGSVGEHLAALTKSDRPRGRASRAPAMPAALPRPSRKELDRAEQALEQANAARDEAVEQLAREEADLVRRRRDLERRYEREAERLSRIRDQKRSEYEEAIARWRKE
ncbi:hypothetical protein [Rhizorhabdus argentea]|uniref:hypothetical protein n=1 Tax=Rhizorhabdus argentea TaxID=1387174 RepID=UPI0030EE2DCF